MPPNKKTSSKILGGDTILFPETALFAIRLPVTAPTAIKLPVILDVPMRGDRIFWIIYPNPKIVLELSSVYEFASTLIAVIEYTSTIGLVSVEENPGLTFPEYLVFAAW